MPRLASEKSISPERPSRHSRFKASTPIEIPPRHRSISISPNSPTSPDMLFEMSPVSPTFPSSSSIYPATSRPRSHEKNIHERFMYHIPIIRQPTGNTGSQLRRKISRQNVVPFRNNSIVALRTGAEKPDAAIPESCITQPSETAHNVPPPKEHVGTKRIQSTTKIIGFTPINEHQPPIYEKPRPTIPLHPPPRRPSFSSSPWILPGRSDHCEDDLSYSQADPSQFEFHRHLLRRIENQDSSRFKSAHTQCF